MAELQLTVPYKSLPARIVFSTMCALFPVWAIIAPSGLGMFIGRTVMHPDSMPVMATVVGCLSLLGLTLAAIATTALSEDNRIHVSKDGISFPAFLLPALKFRRARSWTELGRADLFVPSASSSELHDGEPVKEGRRLLLTFDSAECLPLKLSRFERSDVEQLLLAIELWATNCKRSPALVDYQTQIQNQGHGVAKVGYTQMWEEELSRRFQATSFVPLEPGKELQDGRLRIVRQLAFGGLSAIYLAQENKLDLVVLKEAVVPPSADAQTRAQAEQHLFREADMLSHLDHPNIARVLDHFVEDGRHYLMLEYVNGADLRQYVKQNGPVDQKTAIMWGIQILDILQTLHSQQPPILHRDLTPENLVLAKDAIVLIDFGAANQFVGAATGTVVGKQAYIPPEQLRGKAVIESDLYAFGGTIYFLLTGKDPLPLSISHPKSVVADIDSELDEIIARSSGFEPEDRYHSASEIAARMKEVLLRLNVESDPSGLVASGEQRA